MSGDAIWLAGGRRPMLAFLHEPAPAAARPSAVLICAPFGWEDICSYRGRRGWALALAQAGYPTARIDLPGTGDSGGGPHDQALLEAWTAGVADAAAWLRDRTGAGRVTAAGIGIGGLLACRAAAQGAPIDDLILWAVPASGRLLLREQRHYASVIAARTPADAHGGPRASEGAEELIGFLVEAETSAALAAVDLTALELPDPARRRVLMLGRDGLGPDRRLRAHLERGGAAVTVADGEGYGRLMTHPQESEMPAATIRATLEWLGGGAAEGGVRGRPAIERAEASLELDGVALRERALRFPLDGGEGFGILTEPVEPGPGALTAVFLGAGALRRIGPNRIWVEAARRWAARGVATVRVDLPGIGDAGGDERELLPNRSLYASQRTAQTIALLDQLVGRGLPDRFVLGGLCSGAYWSLHTALADARVAAIAMINLYAFEWSPELVAERDGHGALESLRSWRRVLRRDVTAGDLRKLARRLSPGRAGHGGFPVERSQRALVERALHQLREQGTEALLLLSEGEPLYEQLARQGVTSSLERWPNLTLERIPSRDHMFRALWLQAHVHDSVDRLLGRLSPRPAIAAHR